jgi:hypothetical protein
MAPPMMSDLTPQTEALMTFLLSKLPPGDTSVQSSFPPNYFDPSYVPGEGRGDMIMGVTIAFTAVALIAVCLRIYTRATQKTNGLGLEDAAIVPAMVSPSLTVVVFMGGKETYTAF